MADTHALLSDAWDSFCDELKDIRSVFERAKVPDGDQDIAAGFRYFSRLLPLAFDRCLENCDPRYPELTHTMNWRRKFGGDNTDGLYLSAIINGTETYRIYGKRGTVSFVAFSVQEPGTTGNGGPAVSNMFDGDIVKEPDGSFEIILSAEPPEPRPRNWLRTTPDTFRVNIRQFFNDWDHEEAMDIAIERLGEPLPAPVVDPEAIAQGIKRSAKWVRDIVETWSSTIALWQARPHEFLAFNEITKGRFNATPGGVPYLCFWEVAEDEAVIIRTTLPKKAAFWNFEFGNWWMESMDYRYRLAGTNAYHAKLEDDGELILVIAHDDPGVPNWLDASGFQSGYIALRWIEADSSPKPEVQKIKRSELFDHLPDNVQRVDAASRRSQLERNRRAIMKRFYGI